MGTGYSNSSLKAVVNSGALSSNAPGFGIKSFSGLTPANTKIITSFDIGRINDGTGMNVKMPVFAKHSPEDSFVLGGSETLSIAEDGRVFFMGSATNKYIKNGKWEKFTVVLDPASQTAQMYINGKIASTQAVGRITGTDGIDFSFFGTNAGQWYVDNLSVKTSDDMPEFDDVSTNLTQLYFDGLKNNEVYSVDGLSYFNFKDETKDVFKMEAKSALFGKDADDVSLAISNTSNPVSISGFSSGNDDERYHGLKLDLPNNILAAGDSVLFETEIAAESLNSTKAIKAAAYTSKGTTGSLGNLISIPMNGHVEVLGTTLRNDNGFIIVQPQKWYNVKILMKRTDSGNRMDVYWDGRLVAKDASFRIDGATTAVFAGLESVSAGYNISHMPIKTSTKLADGSYSAYTADAMYLDNTVLSVYKNVQPPVEEVSVSSYDPYYFHTIDVSGAKLYTYGQDTVRFINKLNITNVKLAEFVTADGTSVSGKADNAAYMRLETTCDEHIYLKTAAGTDSYLLSLDNINADNSWNKDLSGFYEYEQPDISKLKGSALDASFVLDGPAGKYGFVQADGDGFVCVDENGNKTPVQFWGTNLGGDGLFPKTHEEADMIADSIAASGFNLVRLHKADGPANNTVFGYRATSGKELDDGQMDKLCYLMYALKQRGIYTFLDIHCSRKVYADDGLDGLNSFGGVIYYDEDVIALLENYAEMLLNYKNPYTGLALKDDPAIACIDIKNENNSLWSYDFDNIKGTKYYTEILERYNKWLLGKYGARDALEKAWNVKPLTPTWGKTALLSGEDPTNNTVEFTKLGSLTKDGKTYQVTASRCIDERKFCSEVMSDSFKRRINHLRSLGVKCVITGETSWGDIQPELWYANYGTDFIDTHYYWSHPYDGQGLLDPGTRYNTNGAKGKDAVTGKDLTGVTSNLKADGLGIIGMISSWQTYGKPYTISEWKICPGNPYIAEGSLLFAAYGRFHGWNPVEFHYLAESDFMTAVKNGDKKVLKDAFSSVDNPILRAVYPANSIMFLRKDISEATSGNYYNYNLTANDRSNIYYVGTDSDGVTTWPNGHYFPNLGNYGLIGNTGVSFCNDNIGAVNDESIKTKADAATNGNKVYVSQSGELETDLKNGIFKMNTKKSQAICGFIGGRAVSSGNLALNIDNEYSSVTLTSLNDKSIENGDRLLLTMVGNAVNYGQLMTEDGSTVAKAGQYPIMAEQITGEVRIKVEGDFSVYPLTSSGERKTALNVTKTSDGFKFNVDKNTKAMNFEIVKK